MEKVPKKCYDYTSICINLLTFVIQENSVDTREPGNNQHCKRILLVITLPFSFITHRLVDIESLIKKQKHTVVIISYTLLTMR